MIHVTFRVPRNLARTLADAGVEVALASPLLASEDGEKATDVALAIRAAMVSEELSKATAAMGAAFLWFEDAGRALPPLPFDFVRDIGMAIFHRRTPTLATALAFATCLIRLHRDRITAAFLEDLKIGLHHILDETNPTRSDGAVSMRGNTVVRAAAVYLLIEYAALATVQDETMLAWFAGAEDRPLTSNRTKLLRRSRASAKRAAEHEVPT